MTENPRVIRESDSVKDALEALEALQVRHLPVVDEEGNLVGMLSDRDLGSLMRPVVEATDVEKAKAPLATRRVTEFMTADVVSVELDAEVASIVDTLLEEKIGAVPVVDGDGNVAGIISYVDLLRALAPNAS